MSYIAIKKVKGRRYAYIQESYRDGGRVRTRTVKYLGAVDDALRITHSEDISKQKKREFINPQKTPVNKEVITTNNLEFPNSISKYKISTTAIEQSHKRWAKRLKDQGVADDHLPEIEVRYGFTDKITKKRDGSYRITFARSITGKRKGGRSQFWQNYRLALSSAYIDALQKGNPEAYQKLYVTMDHSHSRTKRLLFDAVRFATTPAQGLMLSLQFLLTDKIPASMHSKAQPEDFGKVDFVKARNWRTEAAHILTQAQKSGWSGHLKKCAQSKKKLLSAISKRRNIIDNQGRLKRMHHLLSGKRLKILREIMHYEKRMQALDQLVHRSQTLKTALNTIA